MHHRSAKGATHEKEMVCAAPGDAQLTNDEWS